MPSSIRHDFLYYAPERTMHEQALKQQIRRLSRPLTPRPTGQTPQLRPLAGIRAVLFDIYGTLVISASGDIGLGGEQDEEQAFQAALKEAGLAAPSGTGPEHLKALIRQAHALRKAQGVVYPEVEIRSIWRQLLFGQQSITPDQEARIERLALAYECRVNPVWPMPGLRDLLRTLRQRGLVLGIVSNAQFYTPLMLETFLECSLEAAGFHRPSCVFSYEHLEAKPSTRLYELAQADLARQGIEPQAVLYVGNDRRNDIWPASQLGFRTALFAGDQRSLRLRSEDPDCAQVQPDCWITELAQLAAVIR